MSLHKGNAFYSGCAWGYGDWRTTLILQIWTHKECLCSLTEGDSRGPGKSLSIREGADTRGIFPYRSLMTSLQAVLVVHVLLPGARRASLSYIFLNVSYVYACFTCMCVCVPLTYLVLREAIQGTSDPQRLYLNLSLLSLFSSLPYFNESFCACPKLIMWWPFGGVYWNY